MTNRDLAAQLHISPTALSMILNHKPGISEATRSRVLQQIREMGYGNRIKEVRQTPPAATADSLYDDRGQICLIIYKRDGNILGQHPYFLLLLESITQRAEQYGYHVTLMTIDRRDSNPAEQIERWNSSRIRGILLFATEMKPEDIEPFSALRIPYVAMDHNFSNQAVNTVAIDNDMGTFQAIRHLFSMGHRKIGYLKSNVEISSFQERSAGYQRTVRNFGMELNPILPVPYSEEESYQAFRKFLQKSPTLPTAFVSDDDTIAIGVLRALLESGVRVPEDVSLVGFNDRPSCVQTTPTLTTVQVPRTSFAFEAVDMLLKLVHQRESEIAASTTKLRIGTQLIIRDSVFQIEA